MVRDSVAKNNARFIPDRSRRMGSRHRSAVTASMPLTPITLITEVSADYIRKRNILQPLNLSVLPLRVSVDL